MGQKSTHLGERLEPKTPLSWILQKPHTTKNPNPEQPIQFQYKTRRKNVNHLTINNNNVTNKFQTINNLNNNGINQSNISLINKQKNNNNEVMCRIVKTQNAPVRTKSEPNLSNGDRRGPREKHRHRRRKLKNDWEDATQQFGYEIQDIDGFLSKATIEKPANIPVVLAFPSVLYQTRIGGYQAEISLPLGMVVNAIFKNQHWLYVQTPHAEEGYVSYASCLPLGIIPPIDKQDASPCWDNNTDIFPKPSGNMTDTEKLSSKSDCDDNSTRCPSRRSRNASTCGEKSVDKLYLRAASRNRKSVTTRHTLVIATKDYYSQGANDINVTKGDVVFLLGTHVKGWFWVRCKDGTEGFIPAAVAGHGFL